MFEVEPSLIPLPALGLADAETVPAAFPVHSGPTFFTPPRTKFHETLGVGVAPSSPEKLPDPKKAKTTHQVHVVPQFGARTPDARGSAPLAPPMYAAGVVPPAGPSVFDMSKGDHQEPPPWVLKLRQGMQDVLGGQRSKRDDVQGITRTLQTHETRLQRLTEAHQDNAKLHENAQRRLNPNTGTWSRDGAGPIAAWHPEVERSTVRS